MYLAVVALNLAVFGIVVFSRQIWRFHFILQRRRLRSVDAATLRLAYRQCCRLLPRQVRLPPDGGHGVRRLVPSDCGGTRSRAISSGGATSSPRSIASS